MALLKLPSASPSACPSQPSHLGHLGYSQAHEPTSKLSGTPGSRMDPELPNGLRAPLLPRRGREHHGSGQSSVAQTEGRGHQRKCPASSLASYGHGSNPPTPSEHPNPHKNGPKWVVHLPVHLPQNGIPLVLIHSHINSLTHRSDVKHRPASDASTISPRPFARIKKHGLACFLC